jgi:uncharacterized protein (TIGR00255 family)
MALQSMTAYGFGERATPALTYACEIRTLNSRYLEVSVRLPRQLIALEVELINHVKSKLKRGKVDVFIDTQRASGSRDLPEIDQQAVQHYLKQQRTLQDLAAKAGVTLAPSDTTRLLQLEGVLSGDAPKSRGPDAIELHKAPVFAAIDAALAAVMTARDAEGRALQIVLTEQLDALESERRKVAARRDVILQEMQRAYVKRLDGVVQSLQKAGVAASASVGDERLIAEVAVFTEKADIDEELTRLATHVAEFARLMRDDPQAGRKLDFLCQEMHREVNTMSNKLVQTEVTTHTIEMKQLIERIRQQVQNIE